MNIILKKVKGAFNLVGGDPLGRIASQLERMKQPREVTEREVDVAFSCNTPLGSAYIMVTHTPEDKEKGIFGDVLLRDKTGGWNLVYTQYRFMPTFVNPYIASIYGHCNKATEAQIAKDIAEAYVCCRDNVVSFGEYAMVFHPGGIEIVTVAQPENIQGGTISFVPYEKYDRDEIKSVYGMVLRRYAEGAEFDDSLVTGDLMSRTIDLGEFSKQIDTTLTK